MACIFHCIFKCTHIYLQIPLVFFLSCICENIFFYNSKEEKKTCTFKHLHMNEAFITAQKKTIHVAPADPPSVMFV